MDEPPLISTNILDWLPQISTNILYEPPLLSTNILDGPLLISTNILDAPPLIITDILDGLPLNGTIILYGPPLISTNILDAPPLIITDILDGLLKGTIILDGPPLISTNISDVPPLNILDGLLKGTIILNGPPLISATVLDEHPWVSQSAPRMHFRQAVTSHSLSLHVIRRVLTFALQARTLKPVLCDKPNKNCSTQLLYFFRCLPGFCFSYRLGVVVYFFAPSLTVSFFFLCQLYVLFNDDSRLRNTLSVRAVGWPLNDALSAVWKEAVVACCCSTFPTSIPLFAPNLRIAKLTTVHFLCTPPLSSTRVVGVERADRYTCTHVHRIYGRLVVNGDRDEFAGDYFSHPECGN